MDIVAAYLTARGVRFGRDSEDQSIFFILGARGVPYTVKLATDEDAHLVVMYVQSTTLSFVDEEFIAEAADFAARANWGLRSGTFEVNVRDGELRYRSSLSLGTASLTPELVDALTVAGLRIAQAYMPGFQAVALGADPEEVEAELERGGDPLSLVADRDDDDSDEDEDEGDEEDETDTDDEASEDYSAISGAGDDAEYLIDRIREPVLAGWADKWRTRWRPLPGGGVEAWVGMQIFHNPDGEPRVRVSIEPVGDDTVRVTVGDIAELPPGDDVARVFLENFSWRASKMRVSYDPDSRRVSLVADVEIEEDDEGISLHFILGSIRVGLESQYVDIGTAVQRAFETLLRR